MSKIIVVEHLDPRSMVPSGIDTIVQGFVSFSSQYEFSYVGITDDPALEIGHWHRVVAAGRASAFMPVARFDRSKKRNGIRIPHSFRFLAGFIRYRKLISVGHIHAHRIETGFLVSLLCSNSFTQFIHNDSHGLLGRNSDSLWRRLGPLYRLMEARVLRRAAGVAIFNRTDAPRLRRIRDDVVIGRTWFDPQVFFPAAVRPRMNPKIVAWVGRLDQQKDPRLALKVGQEILRRGLPMEVHMVGDGPMRLELQNAVKRDHLETAVKVCGPRSRTEVAEFLRNSNVFLMTSHYEGSPTVLVEALASGLPAVCTAGADPDLVLIEGVTGARLDQRDPIALVDALERAVEYDSQECVTAVADRSASQAISPLVSLGIAPETKRAQRK